MKRLILSAVVALFIHAVLMSINYEGLWSRPYEKPTIKFMTLTASSSAPKSEKVAAVKEVKKKDEKPPKPPKPPKPRKVKTKPVRKSVPKKVPEKIIKEIPVKKKANESEKKQEPVKTVVKPISAPVEAPPEEENEEPSEEKKTEEVDSKIADESVKESKAQAEVKQAFPLYSSNPPPLYPRAARARGFQGIVVLEVLVRVDGKVGDVRIMQSSGHGILDRAALSSVRKWIFEPGRRGGIRLETWVKVPVRFKLKL